jgi:hypothetical protein
MSDFVKLAQEYDSAGRIMARGFYDEFTKLAVKGKKRRKKGRKGSASSGAVHMFMQD